jgi:hypothetical protein
VSLVQEVRWDFPIACIADFSALVFCISGKLAQERRWMMRTEEEIRKKRELVIAAMGTQELIGEAGGSSPLGSWGK